MEAVRADFPAVLDACVLAPASTCDLFLRLAEEPRLYSPRWSQTILDEARRTQINKLGWPERLADFWRREVTKSFPEALVTGYEPLIQECLNHEEDRHVLAAAIKAPAYAIITFNLKHFPTRALKPHSIDLHHPADYLCTLYEMAPGVVTARLNEIAAARTLELTDLLRQLSKSVRRFTEYVSDRQGLSL